MTCPSTYTPNKLHTELLERSSGSAGSGLKATLPGRGGRQEPGRDTLAPLVQPPGNTLPHPKVEQKAAQRLQSLPLPPALPAQRKQVHWNGFLLLSRLQRAPASSSNGQTCWRPPYPGDTLTAPLQGTLPSAWPSWP